MNMPISKLTNILNNILYSFETHDEFERGNASYV